MKKQNGITLIALVVTVIVLLILAGVAINMTIGSNGIFSNGKKAAEKYKEADLKEKIQMALMSSKMNTGVEAGKVNLAILEDELVNKYGFTIESKSEDGALPWTVSKDGVTVTVEDNAGSFTGEASSGEEKVSAADVSFTPANSNWKVSTVQQALDSLYNN